METSVLGSRKTPERYNDYDDDGDLVDDGGGDLQEVGMEWLVAFSKMRRGSSSQKLQDGRRGGREGGSSLPGKSVLDVATDCFVQGERAGEMEAEKGRAAGSQAPISSQLTFSAKKEKNQVGLFHFFATQNFSGFSEQRLQWTWTNKGSNGHGTCTNKGSNKRTNKGTEKVFNGQLDQL